MNKFYEAVAGVLEVPEVGFDTRFRETDGWCSLQAFGLLVMMENDWATPLTIDRLRGLETVGDLLREAFLSFAADLLQVDRAQLTGASAMGSVPAWDSVNHLRLLMESEKRFGFSFNLEQIPSIATIDDFLTAATADT